MWRWGIVLCVFKFQMGIMKSVIGKLEPFSTIKECFVRMLKVFNCLRK